MRRTNEPGRFARSRGNTLALAALVGLVGALIPATAWGESAATPTPEPGFTAVPDETMTSPETTSTSAPEPTPSALPVPTPTQTAGPAPQESAAADEATTVPDPTDPASYGGDTTEDEAQPGGYAGPEGFQATSLVGWKAGNIISDAKMFASGTMSTAQIQTFLNGKVPKCKSGYVCLKDYKQNTITKAATTWCPGTYQGAQAESAASIISKVAKACGVNEQVLLVMLQKEQGLVTHVWPSDWRYTIAMGYACPDNAACDTAYYGFQNQIYMAASQLKRYTMDSWFNWYPVGRTSNVRWHPNASCGSGAVFIENKATAALYYYTPYQPNAAALRAGYGEGDSCSAYGNRNFYNYFTDWFGSTQAPAPAGMVNAGFHIYLVTGGKRIHIGPEVVDEYRAAFGAPRAVSQSALDALADGGKASLYVRNASTGWVGFLQGGEVHHFPSCDLVAAWGGRCGAETVVAAAELNRLRVGEAMTYFAIDPAGARMYRLEGQKARWLASPSAARGINNGVLPYAATMPASVWGTYSRGITIFMPGAFVQRAGDSRVFLPTTDGRLIYLPAWVVADEAGFARHLYTDVSSADLAGFRTEATLSSFIRCDSALFFGGAGSLRALTGQAAEGVSGTQPGPTVCRAIKRSSLAPLSKLFVAGEGQFAVYYAERGQFRHVAGTAVLARLGGSTSTVMSVDPLLIPRLPKGPVIR